MKAKEFIPAEKPRNFVVKNAKMGGAGAHKDKKKAEKQGDLKHKNKQFEQGVAEGWDKLTPQQKAHEYNLDASQREMDRRHAQGEDMTGAKIDKKTYKIVKPKQQGVAEGSLEELANTSLKVKEPKNFVNTNDRKQVVYKVMKFKSGKDTYLINFTVKSAPAFGKKQNWNAVNVAFGVREEQDDYSFGDEIDTDLTAKNKNQFLIYSTVINAVRKFITEYNTEIDEIIMQGAGERQEAMYQRFFQSAGKYFPGWHHDGKHSLVRDVPRQPGKKVREQGVAAEGYGNHPSQRVDPRTGKKYVPPRSPLGQGVAEGGFPKKISQKEVDKFQKKHNDKLTGREVNRQEQEKKPADNTKKQGVAAEIQELSTGKLALYKKAAGADAKKADADGDYARGDKRFKGINTATKKQFDNDLKKHGQQGVAERVRDPEDWDEGNTEPPNNFAVYINGKKWKVFKGRGRYADDNREQAHYQQLKDWAAKKSADTGKKWTVSITGEAATE